MQRWRPRVAAQAAWARCPRCSAGLCCTASAMRSKRASRSIAEIVARETGKSPKEAFGETGGAIALGRFFAGEGQRLYGRTTTSGTPDKYAMTVRQPCGVAGLIIAANTPIANVAWKVFPALICGNAAVLKAPRTRRARPGCSPRSRMRPGCRPACSMSCRAIGPKAARRSSSIRTSTW